CKQFTGNGWVGYSDPDNHYFCCSDDMPNGGKPASLSCSTSQGAWVVLCDPAYSVADGFQGESDFQECVLAGFILHEAAHLCGIDTEEGADSAAGKVMDCCCK